MPPKPDREYGSALAREIARIPRPIRERFGATDAPLAVLNFIVEAVRAILETSDPSKLEGQLERLGEELEKTFPDDLPSEARMQAWARWVTVYGPGRAERYVRMIKRGRPFWRRLLGAAHYDRLARAMAEDGALLLLAGRRLARYILPVAAALDNIALVMPDARRAEFKGFALDSKTHVETIFQIDAAIDTLVERQQIPFETLPLFSESDHRFEVNLESLVGTLRASLETETIDMTREISDALARKLQGFSDALEQSADGVSQAANSLVEYVDRLLRGSFDESDVLRWVETHRGGEANDLTYTDKVTGKVRPTKLAQALCFTHAGGEPAADDDWNRAAAVALVEVRRQAEKLKHSDFGSEAEAEQLRKLMNATQGFFVFSVRLSWALIERTRFDELRERFRAA